MLNIVKKEVQKEQCMIFFVIFACHQQVIEMDNAENLKTLQECLDEYMIRTGRHEIDEIEANSALAHAGLLNDEDQHPGRPLRDILVRLRDSNHLPQNIRQIYGLWKIKLSRTIMKYPLILQF